MENGWLFQSVLIFSWLNSCAAHAVTGPSLSCLRSSHTDGQTLVTFLREDAPVGLRVLLYLTKWTDTRLVACEIHSHPSFTQRYRAFCEKSKYVGDEIPQGLNVSALLSPGSPCVLAPSRPQEFTGRAAGEGTEGRARRKRSWIFPGTLWCGSGSRAAGYEQLGMFERADRCCREHDHCLHAIPAFTMKYGIFNSNFFTVSHCECDQRFRQCLLGMNDSISTMVGYSFFSILKVPCFELKQEKRCTQTYWWGMCKAAKKALYAVFKSPLPYNSSDVVSNDTQTDNKNLTSSEEQRLSEPQRRRSKQRCEHRDPARGDTFHHRRSKKGGCKRHQKQRTSTTQVPTTLGTHTTTHTRKNLQTLMPKKKRAGKRKSLGKKGFEKLSQTNKIRQRVSTSPNQKLSPTTPPSIPSLTQRRKLPINSTTTMKKVTKSTKRKQKVQKQRECCGFRPSGRNNTSQSHCTTCLKQKTPPHTGAVTLSKTKRTESPVSQMEKEGADVKKTTETSTQMTSAAPSTPILTEKKTPASLDEDGKTHKVLGFHLLMNKTSLHPLSGTVSENIHTKKSTNHIYKLRNLTDNQIQCRSLKHLDDCKFKIPPLLKKYNLQNTENKTAYHCDCTSSLAVQIRSFKQPGVPSSLLEDFVSQQCFNLPKEKKCKSKKRCFEGFTKASDLHQALKKLKERYTIEQANDKKKRIPVRLYKLCLKLQMKADIMAQLQ